MYPIEAMVRMNEYHWPGNVRQLENILTRALIDTHGDAVPDEVLAPLPENDTRAESKYRPKTSRRPQRMRNGTSLGERLHDSLFMADETPGPSRTREW